MHDGFARSGGVVVEAGIDRRDRRTPRQRHPEGLADGGHRVRREHAGARPGSRTRRGLDLLELLVVDRALAVGSDPLEDVDDRDVTAPVVARQAAAAVQEDGGQVDPRLGHEHPRQRLVASGDVHHAVEALGMHDELDGVGDHLTGYERGAHALVPHGDPVGHRDGRELERDPARAAHPRLGVSGEPLTGDVAGSDLVACRDDSDLGLREVVVRESDGPQHRPGGRLCRSFADVLGVDLVRHGGEGSHPSGAGQMGPTAPLQEGAHPEQDIGGDDDDEHDHQDESEGHAR